MSNYIKVDINDRELNNFLRDVEEKTKIYILSEAKKKDEKELIEIAKKRGIIVKDSFDLGIAKLEYVFPDDANDNNNRVPKDELLKRLPTLIGKPLSIDHIRRYVIGYYIDYKYIEKENKVIAYAIIFKDAFDKEWKQFVARFNKGELKTSYEIWNDADKEEKLSDGSIILHDLQMGGGSILWKEEPADSRCNVLAMAKKNLDSSKKMRLVYACVNKDGLCSLNKKNYRVITASTDENSGDKKIICANCGFNFVKQFAEGQTSEIKCPKCFAILDSAGKMIYPPQIKNFNMNCPNCGARDWRTLAKKDNEAEIKCLSCAEEYKITFKKPVDLGIVKNLTFLRKIAVHCYQCSELNVKYVSSKQETINIECQKCGLKFAYDVTHKLIKEIDKIEKIKKSSNKEEDMANKYVLSEAKLELTDEDLVKFESDNYDLTKAKKLDTKQRNDLPDSSFAVVITVKNKKTGKPRKIRKYPIQDKAHVRNALSRLGQEAPQAELRKYGISVRAVIRKVLKRAKELGMTSVLKRRGIAKEKVKALLKKAGKKILDAKKSHYITETMLKKYAGGIKKLAKRIKDDRATENSYKLKVASLENKVVETKKFYLANAKKISNRRTVLGEFGNDLSDERILDDVRYKLAIAKKKLAKKEAEEKVRKTEAKKKELKTASLNVGAIEVEDEYKQNQKRVNEVAFGNTEQ